MPRTHLVSRGGMPRAENQAAHTGQPLGALCAAPTQRHHKMERSVPGNGVEKSSSHADQLWDCRRSSPSGPCQPHPVPPSSSSILLPAAPRRWPLPGLLQAASWHQGLCSCPTRLPSPSWRLLLKEAHFQHTENPQSMWAITTQTSF